MNKNKKVSNILIVDHNPINLQILENYLQIEGFYIEFALNGNTALEWVKNAKFDLILHDINMPELDGYETCRIIKSCARFHGNIRSRRTPCSRKLAFTFYEIQIK